jgi:pre-rRNA-processing protein TSR2
MATSSTTPAPDIVLFARGVIAILELWPALRVAVDESWGGPESKDKRRWMAGEVVDLFEASLPSATQKSKSKTETPDAVYVEELLLQVMNDEYETMLEDGSQEIVAERIVKLWNLILDTTPEGNESAKQEVVKFEELVAKLKGKKVQVQVEQGGDEVEGEGEEGDSSDEDDDGVDAMDVEDQDEAPQLVPKQKEEPEVDEDGFTMVKKKGKGRG